MGRARTATSALTLSLSKGEQVAEVVLRQAQGARSVGAASARVRGPALRQFQGKRSVGGRPRGFAGRPFDKLRGSGRWGLGHLRARALSRTNALHPTGQTPFIPPDKRPPLHRKTLFTGQIDLRQTSELAASAPPLTARTLIGARPEGRNWVLSPANLCCPSRCRGSSSRSRGSAWSACSCSSPVNHDDSRRQQGTLTIFDMVSKRFTNSGRAALRGQVKPPLQTFVTHWTSDQIALGRVALHGD